MKPLSMKIFVKRAERRPVTLRGFAINETRDSDILVADLSYNGCRIHCDDRFATGEVVELRVVKRGAIQAEIRWAAEGRAGAAFIG